MNKKRLEGYEDDNNEQIDDDIYARFNHHDDEVDEIEKKNEHGSKKSSDNHDKDKKDGYLESHTTVTNTSKISRIILFGFYIILIMIGVMIFFMLRSDKYEFYLTKEEINIKKGSTYQVELTPKKIRYFDYLNYKYEVSDENIAKVDEFGTITAVGVGTTTLKISLRPGLISKKMKINIEDININDIKLLVYEDQTLKSGNMVSLEPNQTITLKAIANSDMNTNMTVDYTSSNPEVATVDEFGNVTAKSVGTTTIVGTRDGVSGEIVINVMNKSIPVSPSDKVTKVSLGTSQVTKYVGDSLTLSPTVTPKTSKINSKMWSSSNASVATVNENGVVNAIKKGTAVITIDIDGVTANCTVIVKDKS